MSPYSGREGARLSVDKQCLLVPTLTGQSYYRERETLKFCAGRRRQKVSGDAVTPPRSLVNALPSSSYVKRRC